MLHFGYLIQPCSRYGITCESYSYLLLEIDIAFVLCERCLPWHISFVGRQLCIELGMCVAINGPSLERAVRIALIGIKESAESDMSETEKVQVAYN